MFFEVLEESLEVEGGVVRPSRSSSCEVSLSSSDCVSSTSLSDPSPEKAPDLFEEVFSSCSESLFSVLEYLERYGRLGSALSLSSCLSVFLSFSVTPYISSAAPRCLFLVFCF